VSVNTNTIQIGILFLAIYYEFTRVHLLYKVTRGSLCNQSKTMLPEFRLVRMPGMDLKTFLNDHVFPEMEATTPVIINSTAVAPIYDIERESTAFASLEKLTRSRAQLKTGVMRMGGVGLKVDGRSSLYEIWWLASGFYAVDMKDDNFVARA